MRYPIATMITLGMCSFCLGAAVDDFWAAPAETIKGYQTLLAAFVAIPTVYVGFRQMTQNRLDRQADRRFTLAPRIDAAKAVLSYARKARGSVGWAHLALLSPLFRRAPQPPTDAIMKQAEIAGAKVSEAMDRVRLGFEGKLVDDTFVSLVAAATAFSALGMREEERLTQSALTDAITACEEQLSDFELMVTGRPRSA